MDVSPFICSICAEASQDICVYCTKDACRNHLCERCKRCSDCCECEFRVTEITHSGDFLSLNGESRYASAKPIVESGVEPGDASPHAPFDEPPPSAEAQ